MLACIEGPVFYDKCLRSQGFIIIMNNLLRMSLLLFSLAFVNTASANFAEALRLYQAGNYEEAFGMFKRMAEVGYALAQFNLGVMYYRGYSVAEDHLQGYAWAKLAEGHDETIDKRIAALYHAFTEEGKIKATETAVELAALYGSEELARTLLPTALADEDCEPSVLPVKKTQPMYPRKALQQGHMGSVTVVFDVDPSGRTKNPTILYGPEVFHRTSLDAVTKFRYEPDRPATGVTNKITYEIVYETAGGSGEVRSLNPRLQEQIDALKQSADSGSPADKYMYALSTAAFDHHRPEHHVLNEYLVDAAQQGLPEAQFMVGRNLLFGEGCEVDTPKGMEWLKRSAQLDYAPAQYLLAVKTKDEPDKRRSSMLWLENAADSGHYPSMLELAWMLATNSDEELRDPKRAVKLAEEAAAAFSDKITGWDTLAAAYASDGDFKRAVRYQKKALKQAKKLNWELPELQAHLLRYGDQSAWVEE